MHGGPEGRRPDDLPAGQDAQHVPLELRTADVVDAVDGTDLAVSRRSWIRRRSIPFSTLDHR